MSLLACWRACKRPSRTPVEQAGNAEESSPGVGSEIPPVCGKTLQTNNDCVCMCVYVYVSVCM